MGKNIPTINTSHTIRASYRRCRYQFYLNYVENYAPLPSAGLLRGSAGHKALAYYYTKGERTDTAGALDVAWKYYEAESTLENLGDLMADYELLKGSLERYFDFAKNNDNFENVEAIEKEFNIDIGHGLVLKGYIDGIVTIKGMTWLLEHKFLKRVETKALDLDQQISIYMLASYLLGYEPAGVFYNIIRIGDGGIAVKEPVLRIPQYRNPEGLEAIYKEIITQGVEIGEFLKNGGAIYRNPTKDCSWDCSFYNGCLSINDSGSNESILNKMPRKPGKRIYLEE